MQKRFFIMGVILILSTQAMAEPQHAMPTFEEAPTHIIDESTLPSSKPHAAPDPLAAPIKRTGPIVKVPGLEPEVPKLELTPADIAAREAALKAVEESADDTVNATARQTRINEALSSLPPEKAKLFESVMRKNVETNREKQMQLRATYVEIRNNFIGAAFNKEDFLAKNAMARQLQAELRQSMDNDLAEIASQMDQTERQTIFNALPTRYTRDLENK